jgi:copper chaperone CopZ
MSTPSKTYAVSGMTCEHCVRAVIGEVEAVPGVTRVEVELASGTMTVAGDAAAAAIRRAVDEAGYELEESTP